MTKHNVAHAVIGAGYGDEGKGLATDALAHHLRAHGERVTVVRSNGGAQAGHGVERPDGTRHVFHHIGAGTLAGARTHLSQFFVAHPMLFLPEAEVLNRLAGPIDVTIDPRALVTTPFDMALNQALEIARGGGRHGSCGLGFGETIERSERGFSLTAADLGTGVELRKQLERIREDWLPARVAELGIDPDVPLLRMMRTSPTILERFLEDALAFHAAVPLRDDADLGKGETILFEGAQGLELDMDLGDFPHVTRSRTGLPNMVEIAREAGLSEIHPLYMTRAYKTRHGAGPLPGEAPLTDHVEIVDLTNIPNDWQGKIRTAPLDLGRLSALITQDLSRVSDCGIDLFPAIGLTCLDQIRHSVPVRTGGSDADWTAGDFLSQVASACGLPLGLASFGPCREQVQIYAPRRAEAEEPQRDFRDF